MYLRLHSQRPSYGLKGIHIHQRLDLSMLQKGAHALLLVFPYFALADHTFFERPTKQGQECNWSVKIHLQSSVWPAEPETCIMGGRYCMFCKTVQRLLQQKAATVEVFIKSFWSYITIELSPYLS